MTLKKKILSKLFGEKKNLHAKKFDPKIRIDAEKLSDKEKMDKGFNGKTYTINELNMISDFIWWYKKQAPKYGYFRSLIDCYFNSKYFNRDGSYKTK